MKTLEDDMLRSQAVVPDTVMSWNVAESLRIPIESFDVLQDKPVSYGDLFMFP